MNILDIKSLNYRTTSLLEFGFKFYFSGKPTVNNLIGLSIVLIILES
jgi:hypothetical protein